MVRGGMSWNGYGAIMAIIAYSGAYGLITMQNCAFDCDLKEIFTHTLEFLPFFLGLQLVASHLMS